jgi:hypothetical protein
MISFGRKTIDVKVYEQDVLIEEQTRYVWKFF